MVASKHYPSHRHKATIQKSFDDLDASDKLFTAEALELASELVADFVRVIQNCKEALGTGVLLNGPSCHSPFE